VETVLVVVHLLAAAVWVGGTVVLVFVGVPVVRTLDGETRARAMKLLGQRWRPIGYGALFVLGVTGVPLATREWTSGTTFHWILIAKIVLAVCLVAVSYVHNFVLGPRVADEMRADSRASYRKLVVVGWISLALTLVVPVLGVVLARLGD
jgi:putative copper resistance protein D